MSDWPDPDRRPGATHATGVINLRPKIDRKAEAERLLTEHFDAIASNHRKRHFRASLNLCPDPVCASAAAYRTAVQ